MWTNSLKLKMPTRQEALPGRAERMAVPAKHFVLGTPLEPPFPSGMELALFGMGCFWGAEKMFWKLEGVYSTSVGYAGGFTPNPTYREVCSGLTGHTEVVRVVFDPKKITYDDLLKVFWENHDPTQGMRQGNDVGTQYRSGIYAFNAAQRQAAEASKSMYAQALKGKGFDAVTTEIVDAPTFYFAEDEERPVGVDLDRHMWIANEAVAQTHGDGARERVGGQPARRNRADQRHGNRAAGPHEISVADPVLPEHHHPKLVAGIEPVGRLVGEGHRGSGGYRFHGSSKLGRLTLEPVVIDVMVEVGRSRRRWRRRHGTRTRRIGTAGEQGREHDRNKQADGPHCESEYKAQQDGPLTPHCG
jgi:peptide-methionine (S)-S-oxide reductase